MIVASNGCEDVCLQIISSCSCFQSGS